MGFPFQRPEPAGAPARPASAPARPAGAAGRVASRRGALASGLIGASLVAFAVVMVLGPSAAVPRVGAGGALVWLHARPSDAVVITLVRVAALAGALGTAVGLAAVSRGWRPSIRQLVGAGIVVVAVFVFLPPAGSTDVLNYASYGRIASLGHSPYVMTPAQLHRTDDAVGVLTPAAWRSAPTVYGPVATAAQWAAGELGGGSMARIVFWIRLGNALAFLATGLALLRLAGPDQVRRARVALLWTVNPLMAFWLIGSGHVDVLIALFTVAALLVLRWRRRVLAAVSAGIFAGAAIAVKLPYAIVAAGMLWSHRWPIGAAITTPMGHRWSWRRLLAGEGKVAGAGAAAVTVSVSYLWPGAADTSTLSRRLSAGARFIFYLPQVLAARPALLGALVLAGTVAVAILLARGLPQDEQRTPGVRLMLALAIASLVVLPVQTPWYDALIFVLLPLMPATGLDYVLLTRCLLLTELVLPGAAPDSGTLSILAARISHFGLFIVILVLIAGSLRGAWQSPPRQPRQPVTALADAGHEEMR
ncbi:MAG TPA: hypothetical protein VNF47_03765 [Streptosporangiaceae bacterium]|nr:hypothetical protein [Streptosporangiaceae bacterium]